MLRSLRSSAGEMNRALALVLLAPAAALGVYAEWAALRRGRFEAAASSSDLRLAFADFVVGMVLVGCGVAARLRRPGSWTGLLLAATGCCWFLGTFATSGWSGYSAFGGLFVTLHRGPLGHALLAYPDGRVRQLRERAAIASVYVLSAVAVVADTTAGLLVTACVIAAAAALRFVQSGGPERRARLVALLTAGGFSAVLLVAAGARVADAGATADRVVLWAYQVVLVLIAVALLLDLALERWTQATVTGLVVDLGALDESAGLRERLAVALGDPSLEIGYRLPEREVYVDDAGRPLVLPDRDSGRAVTILGGDDDAVAALVHDGNALADRRLLDSVAAAARMAVTNARLQAEIRRQLEEIESSRRRIVEAGDAQRQRLERQLREGAERRLAEVAALLDEAGDGAGEDYLAALAETRDELARAQAELREFARGIHPAILADGGLAPAVADLVARAPVPVELVVAAGRFPAPVEAAAYFVCSEALANIGKYAEASHARIEVAEREAVLRVTVSDDGRGGASLDAGSGLRGLTDRVEALGGSLGVESPPGAGTSLSAVLPLREPALTAGPASAAGTPC